nr:ATP-binding protein [uncultured Polaribacter sp.]
MLSINEIKSLITSEEGYNVEFKKSIPSKVKEITEEICAFSNAAGGTILLGVDDNNSIQGILFSNAKRSAL